MNNMKYEKVVKIYACGQPFSLYLTFKLISNPYDQ